MPTSGTSRASTPQVRELFGLELPIKEWADEEGVDDEEIRSGITKAADEQMRRAQGRPLRRRDHARDREEVLLQTIDQQLARASGHLDHLRNVVGFRGYAQRDPLNEYKTEAFQLFEAC